MPQQDDEMVWKGTLNTIRYVFYPGRDSTQLQVTKYIGDKTLVTTTGENAYYPYPHIHTIPRESLWLYPALSEVNLDNTNGLNVYFAMKRWWNGIQINHSTPVYTPHYPIDESGSLQYYTVDKSLSSLGQKSDIEDHRRKIVSLRSQTPEIKNLVLFGISRGAATTFSALAKHQYQDVKLCVLEGVPSSMSGVFKSYVKHRDLGKFAYRLLGKTSVLGAQHSTEKIHQARSYVNDFPNDVPLLIVSSQVDEVVPHENSIRLALRVAAKRLIAKEEGEMVAPVYFLQLDEVTHNHYAMYDSPDAKRYEAFIHTLYKKQGLPYIKALADEHHEPIELTELTAGFLSKQVRHQIAFWERRQERPIIRRKAFFALKQQLEDAKLEDDSHNRILSIASAMPLYAKSLTSRFSLWDTPIQGELKALYKTEANTLSNTPTCSP